jgi:hypothetical protein
MYYLFYGTDAAKARARMHEILEAGKKKRPDAEVFRVEGAGFQAGMIDEWAGGMGLFERKMIVILDRVFENKEAGEEIAGRAEALGASENMILILEGKLDKKTLTKLEKFAHKAEAFDEPKEAGRFMAARTGGGMAPAGKDFNIFALTDALGARNRPLLWALFVKSQFREIAAEEISGVLFWQAKAMLLAGEPDATAASTGLSPYVFGKAKNYARNYSPKELRDLSSKLVSIYHDAHRGIHDFPIALERLALSL